VNSQPSQPGQFPQFPTVGRWVVTAIPRGWLLLHGFGVRRMMADPAAVAATIGLVNDALEPTATVLEYIDKQKQLLEQSLKEPSFAGPQATSFQGADEAFVFLTRHNVEQVGNMTHVQSYVRAGSWLGIVTLTAPHEEIPAIRPEYDAFLKGLYIAPAPEAAQLAGAESPPPGSDGTRTP